MVTLNDVLGALRAELEESGRPIATAPEVAERLPQTRRKTLDDLRLLERNGDVKSHDVGANATVWWPVAHDNDSPREEESADHNHDDPAHDETPQRAESRRETPPISDEREPLPSTPDARNGRTTAETPDDVIEAVLTGWRPGHSAEDREQRREIGRRALEWLRARDVPATASDFKTALYKETHLDGQGEQSWWEQVVREALQRAEDGGLVEYSRGRQEYQWVGAGEQDSDDFPTTDGTYDPIKDL